MQLIDKDALKAYWGMGEDCGLCDKDFNKDCFYNDFSRADICEAIDQQSIVDAVPVVRCTECKYYGKSQFAGYWFCENWQIDTNGELTKPSEFYCADGVKEE